MHKTIIIGLIGSILAFGAADERLSAQAADNATLVANIIKSQDDYATKAFQMFAERVSEHTGGSVTVDVHFGGELGYKAADGLRILQNRSVDISETIGAFEGATVPDIMITTLPFFITSFDEFAFFDSLFRSHLDNLFAERNAKCLFSYSLTAQHFWNKKEVDTLDDVKGVKMRTYDKNTTDMLDAVGAAPLRIDFTELYTALQQGTVDGMVTSIASVISLKAWEVVTYANLTGFSTGGLNCLAINTEAWSELSGDQKAGVLEAAREVEHWLRRRVPEIERTGLDTLRENGMTVNAVPAETILEMRQLTEGIRKDFLENKASDELRAIVDDYERIRGLK